MTPSRAALAYYTGACALLATTATIYLTPYWPAAAIPLYAAGVCLWCGYRETALARHARVDAQRAELAARPAPCCLLWQMSDGGDHGADCTLGPGLVAEIHQGWTEINSACCLTSWQTRGTTHDTAHCTRTDQTA
ncbi:hypothetical protein GPA10_05080 [Streptomyces sp. p1417]|uniref:Uncharacterized protein n=1 Tax=Streptomyces typhae TaxID=2681492 RepID=A0A6L6WRF5_9ACTN|nr:hypothetical protein [Streptomyces typhae]MVO84159.1 hypothetical protein [Streptomyces typhae]